mgnify:CR=1 FL=1
MDRSGFTRRHGQSCLLGQWTGSCRPNSVVCQAGRQAASRRVCPVSAWPQCASSLRQRSGCAASGPVHTHHEAASWSASGPSVIGAGASSDGDAQTSSSPAAGAAADSPPAQWHDGDVLELTLADGRSVYAEVEVPGAGAGAVTASVSGTGAGGGRGSSAQGRQRQQQQQQARRSGRHPPAPPPAVAAVAGASAPANFSPHVICNGARYKLEAHEGQAAWVLRATSGARRLFRPTGLPLHVRKEI